MPFRRVPGAPRGEGGVPAGAGGEAEERGRSEDKGERGGGKVSRRKRPRGITKGQLDQLSMTVDRTSVLVCFFLYNILDPKNFRLRRSVRMFFNKTV